MDILNLDEKVKPIKALLLACLTVGVLTLLLTLLKR